MADAQRYHERDSNDWYVWINLDVSRFRGVRTLADLGARPSSSRSSAMVKGAVADWLEGGLPGR